jgi:hypothetical protein
MWKHVPNILTFIRLGMTFVFLGMILYSPYVANRSFFLDVAFAIFVVAGLTTDRRARGPAFNARAWPMIDPCRQSWSPALHLFRDIGIPSSSIGPATLAIVHWLSRARLRRLCHDPASDGGHEASTSPR